MNYINIITSELIKMGFKCSLIGYKYIKELLILELSGSRMLPLKDYGYTYLSSKYGANVDAIDKAIQNAISNAWNCNNNDYLYEIFVSSIDQMKGKPTNKQFLLTMVNKIKCYYTTNNDTISI